MPLIGRAAVDKAIEKRYLQANDDVKGVYLAGLTQIISGTPVDSGRARNNWFLSVGSPSGATTSSKSKGLATIRQLRKMPKRVLGRKLYFTNNLPYIGLLEYGGYPKPVKKGSYNKKTKKYEILSINGYSMQTDGGPWVRPTLLKMASKIRKL